jgi:hypothetical protein
MCTQPPPACFTPQPTWRRRTKCVIWCCTSVNQLCSAKSLRRCRWLPSCSVTSCSAFVCSHHVPDRPGQGAVHRQMNSIHLASKTQRRCCPTIYVNVFKWIVGSWFRASSSMHIHTKCPTRCNTSILILLQDHSTCFGYFPYPSSGVQ